MNNDIISSLGNSLDVLKMKITELNDMFTEARKYGRENRVISSLVKPSCLVIDEVGYCNFDTENTRLFFDMIDRR